MSRGLCPSEGDKVPQKEMKLDDDEEKETEESAPVKESVKESIQNGKDKTINTTAKRSGIQMKPNKQKEQKNKTKNTPRTQFCRSH